MLRTYTRQSPSEIRSGDVVEDSNGRKYVAVSDAERLFPDTEDYSVMGEVNGERHYFDYMWGDSVNITFDETEDMYA